MRHRLFNYLELDLSVNNFLTSEDRERKMGDIMFRLGLNKTIYMKDIELICGHIYSTKDEVLLDLFNTIIVLNNVPKRCCDILQYLKDKIKKLSAGYSYKYEILAIIQYLMLARIKENIGNFSIDDNKKHIIIKKLENIRIARYESNLIKLKNITSCVLEGFECVNITRHDDLISLYAHIS